ncbi:MAG: carbohydrate-binding family V/XII [Pyrinomonadaceae bacterium]
MKLIFALLITVAATLSLVTWPNAAVAQTRPESSSRANTGDTGWPRKFTIDDTSFAFCQPQVEEWVGNRLSARAAISVFDDKAKPSSYGVVWFTARTEIDRVDRLVTLSQMKITKLSVPSAPDKSAQYQSLLQGKAATKVEVIGLDRLLADMAVNFTQDKSSVREVKNDPPKIFFSTRNAILILIDGSPVLRPVENTNLERIINTRVLILRDLSSKKFYLRLADGWLESEAATGPWHMTDQVSSDMKIALKAAAASEQVDLLNGSANGSSTRKQTSIDAANQESIPEIYVSTGPAELLQTLGEPQVALIEGTQLLFVTNTENDIFVYTATQDHYILIAGRWFSSSSMKGQWNHVPQGKLPLDFTRIPTTHPKANVLASVPGTPQAKEALIANSIPQTATITRSAATLKVNYDGSPQFKRIDGTSLQYAVNTMTPVVGVDSNSYYAVQNGVWFVAKSPNGPWSVAASVPAVVYSIPPSSPLHYITYVRIYESTPEVVYVGYTPGYYGTVVSTGGVVVYGTGWYYPPYVGTYWYGAPYTYGCGVAFTWGVASGWGFSYGYGYAWSNYYYPAPWWGPVGNATIGYYGVNGWGGVASTNIYGQWGNVAYSGTKAAWANPYTGNVGRGGVYTGTNSVTGTRYAARAGTNTNVFTGTTMTGGGAVVYDPNTGRISAGQARTVSNAYTGNSAAGTRGVNYDPQTGVVSGGSVGGVRNASTGQITAGGSAFTYNSRTDTGVAVANNNVYAAKDGNVYRYNPSSGAQQNTGSGWQSVEGPAERSWVQNQQQARSVGERRTRDFSSARGNLGGGFRGGGRRR